MTAQRMPTPKLFYCVTLAIKQLDKANCRYRCIFWGHGH